MSGAYRLLIVSGLVLTCLALEAAAVARADTWTQRRPNSTLYPHLPQTTRTPSNNPPNSSQQWGRYNLTAGSNNNYINNNNWQQRNNTAPQYPGSSVHRGQQTPWTSYNQTPGVDRRSNFASTPQPNKNVGWWGNAPNATRMPQQYPSGGGGFQPGANYAPGNWAAQANSTRHTTPQPNRNPGWGAAAGFGGQADIRSPQQPGGFQPQSWSGRPSYNGTGTANWNAPVSNIHASTPPPFQPNAGGWGAPAHASFGGQQPNAPRPNSTGTVPLKPAGDKSQWNAGGGLQPGWASEPNNNAGSRTPGLAPLAPGGANNQWRAGDNPQWNAGGTPQWNSGDHAQPSWSADPASNTGPTSSGSVPLAPIGGNGPWYGGGNTQGGSRTALAPLEGGGTAWNGGQAGLSYSGGQPQPQPNGPNANPYANLFN